MPKHQLIIPDRTGDSRVEFDTENATEVTDAEKRFKEIIGQGRAAVALGENGQPGKVIKSFDPTVERTLFIPALKGG